MKLRKLIVMLSMAFLSMAPAMAQVSIGIASPGLSIGINVPVYPQLVRVPGYPVYYAPGMRSNYFFYDGMYWVYQGDNWYASTWYNGPWGLVSPEVVPLYILRVPVSYYRSPPPYFRGWQGNQPPRWGEHWGQGWTQQHSGWDRWDHRSAPAAAPLPAYQRQYSGTRYPAPQQQTAIQSQNYRYQPHDQVVQQHYQTQAARPSLAPAPAPRAQQQAPAPRVQQQAPAPREQQQAPAPRVQPQERAPVQQPSRQPQHEQQAPKAAPQHEQQAPRAAPQQQQQQQAPRAAPQHEQQAPRAAPQHEQQAPKAAPQREQSRGKEQPKDEEKGGERGQKN